MGVKQRGLARSVVDGLVGGGSEICTRLEVAAGLKLDHEDTDELLDRVNPIVRAGRAAPPVFANRTKSNRLRGIEHDPDAQAEAHSGHQPVGWELLWPHVTGGHEFDGFSA